jgi:uncharacterized protein
MSSAKQGGPVLPSVSVWRPLGPGEITVTGGIWQHKQRVNAGTTLGHCLTWMERVGWTGNFDRAASHVTGACLAGDGPAGAGNASADGPSVGGPSAGGGEHAGIEFVDSEVYKLLEAMAWELGREPDPLLERDYQALARRVAAAQQPDGYLHTSFGRPGQPARYSNLETGHELYCFGHLFQAAVARLRTGHDDLIPRVARRLADHVYDEFGPDGRVGVCGHPEIEMALVELARATGEDRYLKLATLFIERRGAGTLGPHPFGQEYFQDDLPVRAVTTLRGHAVRALYLASGALDVATETGDAELAAAVRAQWAAAVARRTYITGGVGSHHLDEAFGADFELPPDRAFAETCAGIASVMLSWRLLLAAGEDKYADLIERTLLNNVLASPRADGRAFYYANTLHQRTPGTVADDESQLSHRAETGLRGAWFDVSCCPTNVARTLASVALYFATASDAGIQLHQYGDYRVSTGLAAGPVTVQVSSDYPASGEITVTVAQAPPAELSIRLRVPGWAHGAAEVSEEPAARGPGHLEFRRVFRAGESLRVAFPVRARVTYPDVRIDAVRGTFAVERGPLVLALESPDLPPQWNVNELAADPGSLASDEAGVTIDVYRHGPTAAPWPYHGLPGYRAGERARTRLIPYHQWANRGPATMRTWLPLASSPSPAEGAEDLTRSP